VTGARGRRHPTSAVGQRTKNTGILTKVIQAVHADQATRDARRAGGAAAALVRGEDPLGTSPPRRHPVLVGYHGSRSSRRALAYAAGMARRLGSPLLVVYVSPVYCSPLSGQVFVLTEEPGAVAGWLHRDLEQTCETVQIAVTVTTRRGLPGWELASAAAEHSADALVIGAPGSRWRRMTRSVSSSLARHPCCPVIVVPLPGTGRRPCGGVIPGPGWPSATLDPRPGIDLLYRKCKICITGEPGCRFRTT
jgi:nucleotide-binding universal stress UspA family protein